MTNLNFGLAFPKRIPKELVEMITNFAYNHSVGEVQTRINNAGRSYELPVPIAWLGYYINDGRLNWPLVYDFATNHTIVVSAVAETANMFHWSLMKYSRMVSHTLMKRSSKRDVVNTLRNWKKHSVSKRFLAELVNLTWLALTGPFTLTKCSYLYNSLRTIQTLTYIDPNVLSRYYRGNDKLPLPVFPEPTNPSIISIMMNV